MNETAPTPSVLRTLLDDALARGPVVLSFYRGDWCPICNLELRALRDLLAGVDAAVTFALGGQPGAVGSPHDRHLPASQVLAALD